MAVPLRLMSIAVLLIAPVLFGLASCGGGGGGGGLLPDGGAGSGGNAGAGATAGTTGGDGGPDCTTSGCPDGQICFGGQCVAECGATPDCSGRECGPDPVCGYPCGTCATGTCTIAGKCECATSCAALGATCGKVSDGCGGELDCGGCFSNMTCTDNVCVVVGCSGEWSDATVEIGKLFSGGGLVVDAQGTVHASWSGGGRFAKKPVDSTWAMETTGKSGWNAALALDASGGVHISQYDSANEISVSSRAAGSTLFNHVVVDSSGGGFQDTTSIVADGSGGLHLRYLSQGALKYASRAPGAATWSTETVASPAYASGSSSRGSDAMAVDSQGGVHIVYFATDKELGYAQKTPGGSWSAQSIDDDAGMLNAPPYIALDAQGGVHALYLNGIARQIRHAHKPAGGAWTKRTLVTKVDQIFGPALAVSDAGTVHVSYQVSGTLHYLQAPPTGTAIDFYNVLATGLKISDASRIALDSAGGVHVLYDSGGSVKYAYRCPGPCPAKSCSELGANCGTLFDGCKQIDCGSCSDPTLCGAGGVANQCCTPTTCAAQGKQCGAISDGCGSLIDCGGCSPTEACGSQTPNQCGACVSGKWTPDTVSSLGDVGSPTAIALDAQGQPQILFGDGTNVDLVHAEYVPGAGWQTSLVDALSGANYKPFGVSLATDPQGGLHAAYSIVLSGGSTVRYAYRASGASSWSMTDVATGMSKLSRPALRRDPQGSLHLAYYDGTLNQLIYAQRAAAGGNWNKLSIGPGGSGGSSGEQIALALDGSGGVHVSYSVTGTFSTELVHGYRPPNGSFSTETLVPAGNIHPHTSIAVDSAGTIHVAYSDWNALRYASKPAGGSWSTAWVSNADYVESTVLLDAQGGTHIVFNDDSTNEKDLRHAYKPAGGTWTTIGAVTQGNVGTANSAVMDAKGGIHVSHLDSTNKNLEYAFRCPD